jgi:hypothetical protein
MEIAMKIATEIERMIHMKIKMHSSRWGSLGAVLCGAVLLSCQGKSPSRHGREEGGVVAAKVAAGGQGVAGHAAATAGAATAGSPDQLADELDALAANVDADGGEALRRRWQGQRVRWAVTRIPALCASEASCYVRPFAPGHRAEAKPHGWLPKLTLAAGEFAKLEAGCGASVECAVTLEGTLDQLNVSDELPTSVHLADVRVASIDLAK